MSGISVNRALLIAAAAGCLVCAVGLWLDPRAMLGCYLAAWFVTAAVAVGSLGVLFTTSLVRAGWTADLREPLTRAALTVPLVGVMVVPVLIGLTTLYPWAAGDVNLPAFKAAWLTPWFFVLRTVGYFAVWTALALWAHHAVADPDARERAAAIGLIVWSLTVSLAGVDWLESIQPTFHSSIYGLIVLAFMLLAGLAFGVVIVLQRLPRQMANASYAGVLLATLLLWAYLHAMQYIIIWAGNIPEEVVWYRDRVEGLWGAALWVLFVGQFIVPFFALLSARVRSDTRALCALAGSTLALRYLEAVVLVLPPLGVTGRELVLCLPAALLVTLACEGVAWNATGQWSRRLAIAGTALRAP
jgi:hypothetical protein